MIREQVQGQNNMQQRLQKVIYIIWNIWKERRIFDNRAMESSALQEVIKGDVQQWQIAWSTTDVGNV
jgi:hypothetical protein